MADEQNARPDELKRKLAALAALIATGFLSVESTDNRAAKALAAADATDALESLAAWVATEFGTKALDTTTLTGSFLAAVQGYLEANRGLGGDAARRYVEMVVEAELRKVEIALVRQAAQRSGTTQIERRLGYSASGPCARCIELAGVHPITFPDLFWEHPNGRCSWHPAGRAAMSESFADLLRGVFAGRGNRGNSQALRDWYDDAARSQINWGHAGDFARCVEIAGKYISDPQGYCNLRHQDATGHPPGHAPGEAKHAALVNGILDAWRVRFGGS